MILSTKNAKISIDKNDIKDLLKPYRMMLLIRRFEERCSQAYSNGLIAGFCHLYIGQEAVVVGTKLAMKHGDKMITGYRDHGHALVCGSQPNELMAELFGKSTGSSGGKGGSMHLFNLDDGFFGGHGIVGAQVSLGTGIAFAEKYKDTDKICLTFFGDGATNQGQVYESFNIAKVLNLPILFIIENNQYAMGTSVHRASSNPTKLYERGVGFGISGVEVDGMDIFDVKLKTSEALRTIRSGGGPVLLEMKTYRYRGHSMSDPGKYRTKDEVESYKKEYDPIEMLGKHLIESKLATEKTLADIDQDVTEEVLRAYEFAKNSPEPNEISLFEDVYQKQF